MVTVDYLRICRSVRLCASVANIRHSSRSTSCLIFPTSPVMWCTWKPVHVRYSGEHCHVVYVETGTRSVLRRALSCGVRGSLYTFGTPAGTVMWCSGNRYMFGTPACTVMWCTWNPVHVRYSGGHWRHTASKPTMFSFKSHIVLLS